MPLVFQFLVLGFTVVVWWAARRDLTRQAVERHTPAVQEWERLQETVEMLIADLERRATVAEQRVAAAELRMRELGPTLRNIPTAPDSVLPPLGTLSASAAADQADDTRPPVGAEESAHDALYAPVYALADSGVSDMAEIARRTGLEQGEVNLILSLRARRLHG